MSDGDYIYLKSGKKYAYSGVVGISLDILDSEIYTGFDNTLGEFDGELTKEDKIEVGLLMAERWRRYVERMTD